MNDDQSPSRPKLGTVAIVGSGALLAWLLLRKRSTTGAAEPIEAPPAPSPPSGPPPPRRCSQLCLSGRGLTLNDQVISADAAAALCTGGADLLVTGDAILGQREAVIAAFRRRGLPIAVRSPGAP